MIFSVKQYKNIDVLQAAQERISIVFDNFPRIYIAFSGGKDSTVVMHLVMEEAIKRNILMDMPEFITLAKDLLAKIKSDQEEVAKGGYCPELMKHREE